MLHSVRYSFVDRLIMRVDRSVMRLASRQPPGPARSAPGHSPAAGSSGLAASPLASRPSPAEDVVDGTLSNAERRRSIGLMRVNHAGEVAAQGLYRGQALFARSADTRRMMRVAALEERDHLVWCESRLAELGGRTSVLDPFWGGGSSAIGALVALLGDEWSLGFISETERQVVAHLERHLRRLPGGDMRSRVILEQMLADEARHGASAMAAGGRTMPLAVRMAMRLTAKVMTTSAYRW